MNAKDHFKAIARTSRRPSQKETQLPQIKRSFSPSTQTNSVNSHSPMPKVSSTRSSSTSRLTLPDTRNSKNGSSSSARNESGKASDKACGIVKGYAANSRRARHRNEDRVSIIINIQHPPHIDQSIWPQSSYYGLYNGHSGRNCAEYLKANLANHILSSSDFPKNTKRALFSSFLEIDQCFLKQAKENGDISGSCALVLLIIGDKCFVANTGDSKAIISMGQGKAVTSITETHRPGETSEYNRIIQAGGRVFTDYIVNSRGENVNYGPHLVEPGKLKVSRTFGDLDAKDEEYGGNPNVIIADPHLKSFPVKKDQDFVFIATSSVFDRLSSREICDIVFKNAKFHSCKGIEYVLATAVEEVLAETVDRGCNENATAILIAFKGFQNFLEESLSTQG